MRNFEILIESLLSLRQLIPLYGLTNQLSLLFKVNNRNIRKKCEIWSKHQNDVNDTINPLTINAPQQIN